MGHQHGSEYRLKFVNHNGQEDVTAWFNQDQVVMVIASARAKGQTFWLLERTIACPECPDREQQILEYPVDHGGSSRCSPHDSRYLVAAGVRNRAAISRS